jgi:hypothetical protein
MENWVVRSLGLVLAGTFIGLGVNWFVFVPVGRPDAAEVTLVLNALTILVAGGIALLVDSPRVASARKVSFGVFGGSLIAFGLIFFTPLGEAA